jgi:general nucleoside transport system permease protein
MGAALSSAAIAGLAGGVEVSAVSHQLTNGISPGFGYTGVIVATLAALTIPGVLLVALLFGDLTVGSFTASRILQIPSTVGEVVQAVLMVSVISVLVFRKYSIILRVKAPQ